MEWLIYFAAVGTSLILTKFLPSYMTQKGKNLATKEDITEITNKVETVKTEYKAKFDKIQKKNEVLADSLKQAKQRYSSKQFDLYNELWHSLVDLQTSANDLWEFLSRNDLKIFANKVFKAKNMIEKSALLIEDEHYNKLMEIMRKYENFQFGKKKLLKLRNLSIHDQDFNENEIFQIIENNRQSREEYFDLLKDLKVHFKNQIMGANYT